MRLNSEYLVHFSYWTAVLIVHSTWQIALHMIVTYDVKHREAAEVIPYLKVGIGLT